MEGDAAAAVVEVRVPEEHEHVGRAAAEAAVLGPEEVALGPGAQHYISSCEMYINR